MDMIGRTILSDLMDVLLIDNKSRDLEQCILVNVLIVAAMHEAAPLDHD